jgi:hypothetical protein
LIVAVRPVDASHQAIDYIDLFSQRRQARDIGIVQLTTLAANA